MTSQGNAALRQLPSGTSIGCLGSLGRFSNTLRDGLRQRGKTPGGAEKSPRRGAEEAKPSVASVLFFFHSPTRHTAVRYDTRKNDPWLTWQKARPWQLNGVLGNAAMEWGWFPDAYTNPETLKHKLLGQAKVEAGGADLRLLMGQAGGVTCTALPSTDLHLVDILP